MTKYSAPSGKGRFLTVLPAPEQLARLEWLNRKVVETDEPLLKTFDKGDSVNYS